MPLSVTAARVGPLGVLTYLVACPETGEAILIDPGGPAPALAAQLQENGWRLKWIVNTHGHADHIAGNDLWAAQTGAQIVMHRLDWEFFSRPEMQDVARAEGFPPLTRVDLLVEDGLRLPLGRVGLWRSSSNPSRRRSCPCRMRPASGRAMIMERPPPPPWPRRRPPTLISLIFFKTAASSERPPAPVHPVAGPVTITVAAPWF